MRKLRAGRGEPDGRTREPFVDESGNMQPIVCRHIILAQFAREDSDPQNSMGVHASRPNANSIVSSVPPAIQTIADAGLPQLSLKHAKQTKHSST
jgi:hypothetical protein